MPYKKNRREAIPITICRYLFMCERNLYLVLMMNRIRHPVKQAMMSVKYMNMVKDEIGF
jgi:hypothetical protein